MEPLASTLVQTRAARVVPASSQQVGLWFIHQADPSCAAYHLLFAAEVVAGPEVGDRVREVLTDLVREHEALRVCFRPGQDGPVQYVEHAVPLDLRHRDARHLDPDALRRQVRADSRAPFDLTAAPLWRIHLYRTGEESWVVAFVAHHIAVDFWSLAMLLAEVRSRLNGTASLFPLDGSAFADHARNQSAYLASGAASGLLAAEAERLAEAPSSIDLCGDRPRPPVPSHEGGSVPFTLSPAVSDGVRVLARETASTRYMTLLAAYNVMLSRLSGQPEVLVGTPTSGRLQRRLRHALGNFVNTVVVRGHVDEASTYRELLAATRERVVAAMRGQELPFPWLVRMLAPQRDPSRTPLFQAGFAWDRLPFLANMGQFFLLEPDPSTAVTVAGARLRPYPVPQQEGQTDLWAEMGGERDGGYVGVLRYNTDIFTEGTARGLAATFVATVEALVGRPDVPMRQLSRCDRQQAAALDRWGHGPVRELPDTTLPALIRAQAGRTPDATALVADGEQWSYARLQRAVDAVAAAVRTAGAGPGACVAVLAERGAPLVAALLGVLEAGAAYVPLDPQLPAARLGYMAADSGARLLLTQERLRAHWPAEIPACRLDDVLADGAGLSGHGTVREPAAAGAHPAASTDLAYVLYTSGSTGRPKGVAVPHRALINLLLSMRAETGFSPSDGLLAVTTVSFDIAALELFLPLVAGGRVIMWDGAAADGAALAARIAESGATWIQATPTSWRMLRDAGWDGSPRLHVLCGGEELPAELADFLAPRVASLRNVYGPTETTVWSTAGVVRPSAGVDLGSPLANTQLLVLDGSGRRVEPGFPGELHIGGAGLADGYWRRQELTAERFVTGLPAAPDRRLYRTGDRVRWTSDGRLLYHGRLDSQVKLRGHRIELGEVEATFQAMDGVAAAVAVVRDDRLVAYLVAEPGVTLAPSALRTSAALTLPQYLVPNLVIILPELPRTANHKIDRSRLPAPSPETDVPFTQPRDAVEITLARVWGELLGLPQVSIHANFFELGGHSLLAVQLAAAVRAEWGRELPVSTLLTHGTIAELAAVIRRDEQDTVRGPLVTLRRGDTARRPLFLFHPFGGTIFCYLELAKHLPPGRAIHALEAPGLDRAGDAEVSVEEMATRYLAHLREAQPHGPYALGGWCFGGVIAFEAAGQLHALGEETDLIAAIDTRAPVPANVPEGADDATLLSWFARDLAVPFGTTLDVPAEELRSLGTDDAFDQILARAAAIGVLPGDSDRAQLLRYFEAYLANGIALQTYFPDPTALDLLLLRATDEPADHGPALGWEPLIRGSLEVVDVPGDHNSVMYPPHAATVAAAIAQWMGEHPR
ncbi:MAG: amino acid adenylation domain-containing protein [Micromonosporaceae bacterium]|nr:amino acid adenylation domain-containing protein [Micromonosporaceae bacterium]